MSSHNNNTSIVADTGATGHFFTQEAADQYIHCAIPLKNIKNVNDGIAVKLPNGDIMYSTKQANLDIDANLPKDATVAHIFPHLASGSLLSVGKLCDAGCTAIFNNKKLYILHNGKIIMQGTRQENKLWTIDSKNKSTTTKQPFQHSLNIMVDTPTIAERIKFHHASLFSPVLETLKIAIENNFLSSFPGFTITQLRKHLPNPSAIVKGHMRATPHSFRSTKQQFKSNYHLYNATDMATNKESHISPEEPPPSQEKENQRTHEIYPACLPASGQIFTDQTGKFPVISSSGNQYLMILYDYDSNYIFAEPIPNRTEFQLLQAYKKMKTTLQRRGLTPKLQRLDNEASRLLQQEMEDSNIKYQLTPAGTHRRNAAETAISIFKNHFISGLATTNPDFPLKLWDKLVPQAEITLNLLRPSRINPRLSAYAQIHGQFDFSKTPLAPPGMKIMAHVLPKNRASWDTHAKPGFYIGPALHHYRCHKVWIKRTQAERIVETVKWIPHANIKAPIPSQASLLHAALSDLQAAIISTNIDGIVPPEDTTLSNQLKQLRDIFTAKLHNTPQPRVPMQTSSTNNITADLRETTTPQPRVEKVPQPRVQQASRTRVPIVDHNSDMIMRDSDKIRQVIRNATRNWPACQVKLNRAADRAKTRSGRTRRTPERLIEEMNVAEVKHYMNAVLNEETGKMEEYRDLIKGKHKEVWQNGMSKELARLSQGRAQGDVVGTNTVVWQHPREMPKNKKPTYMRICANYRPQKKDPFRIRCTVGGNLIDYPGYTYAPTCELTTFKLFVNSTLSTPGAKFADADISDFYLMSELDDPEYMLVPLHVFPPDIIEHYKIDEKVDHRGLVLAKIIRGMYGLPQAGRLAYEQLLPYLEQAGYIRAGITPGLFKHKTRPIQFILVVDDFGIKFKSQEDLDHLINHLKKKFRVTVGDGSLYCGINIDWDYNKREAKLHMPTYINKALSKFNYEPKKIPEHSPHASAEIRYSKKPQLAPATFKDFPPLTKKQKNYAQSIIGTWNFYARAVDPTMLPAVGTIATNLTCSPYEVLQKKINQLLDYSHTHPNATIKYIASQMHLWSHTDASYLSESKARSRAGGYLYLSDKPKLPIKPNDQEPPHNGPVHVLCKIIDSVMSSAQEAELGGGYLNAREIIPMRQALVEMGHPQGPTPMQFDNKTANDLLNGDSQQRKSKHMDMRFHWLLDRERQKQFHFHWKRGELNKADYVTKHHPAKHHKAIRHTYVCNYLERFNAISSLQGCASLRDRYKTSKRIPLATVGKYKLPNLDEIIRRAHNI